MTDETQVTNDMDAVDINDQAAVIAATGDEMPDIEGEGEAERKKRHETWQERRQREKDRKAQLREDLAAAQAKIAELEEKANSIVAPRADAEPKEVDFKDYADYIAAKTEWRLDQSLANREKKMVTEQSDAANKVAADLEQQEVALLWNNWDSQKTNAQARYGDFDEVIKGGVFPQGTALLDMVLRADSPADLAYAIAQDRALNARLLQMPPVEAARHIGRLEASLSQAKPRTTSQAPAPISPLKGTASGTRDPAKMTPQEWAAYRSGGGKVA